MRRRVLMVGGLALLTTVGALVLTAAMASAPQTGLWGDLSFEPREASALRSPADEFVVLVLEEPFTQIALDPPKTGVAILSVPIELIRNGSGGTFDAYEQFSVRGSERGNAQERFMERAASGSVTVSHLRDDGFDLQWSVITDSGKTSFGHVFARWKNSF